MKLDMICRRKDDRGKFHAAIDIHQLARASHREFLSIAIVRRCKNVFVRGYARA